MANAALVGERKSRLTHADIGRFIDLLGNLSLQQDARLASQYVAEILPLARVHGLSAYDAAYLELSIRHRAPLATLDNKLREAAKRSGVKLFEGNYRAS